VTIATQDLTITWGGTAITGTNGNVTRTLRHIPTFSPYGSRPDGLYSGPADAVAEQGDPPVDPMTITLHLTSRCDAGTALANERELSDDMRTLHQSLNPFDGAQTLRIARTDHDGGAVSSEVYKCRLVSVPRYGRSIVAAGGHMSPTGGQLDTDFVIWCPIPYFYDTTATTTTVVADDPLNSYTLNNAGIGPIGAKFVIDSITGAPTKITINNSTASESFIWSKGSAFAAAEEVDFFYANPTQVTWDNTLGSSGSPPYFELDEGDNTVTAFRDSGTGTVTMTASWKNRYLTL